MGLKVERWFPIVLGLVAGVAYIRLLNWYQLPETTKDVLSAVIGVSAISVGFLATSKSILLSIDGRRVVRQLRQLGYYNDVINYLMAAINWSFGLGLISMFLLLVDFKSHRRWDTWATAAWLVVFVTAFASYYRIIRIFSKILRAGE